MNSIKLFLLSFLRNIFSYILIILEIAALLVAENYMICTLHEREMLNAAYYPLLGENSAYAVDMGWMFKGETFNESRENALKNITQNYKIYDTLSYEDSEIAIISISDEIYKNLALPLSVGSYGDVQSGAVGTVNTKMGKNSVTFIDGSSKSFDVCGLLTNSTYLPFASSASSSGTTVSDFYSVSINDQKSTILTSRTAIKGCEEKFVCKPGFIIEFEDDAEAGIKELRRNKATVTPSKEIIDASNAALAADRNRFLPLIIAIGIVVIVGIICISVITFKENERRNGVLWICGYSRLGIIGVHCAGIALITVMSVIITFAAYGFMKLGNSELVSGINLTFANIFATVITAALLTAFSAVIPALKSRKTSPVEYFRRTL